MKFLLCSVLCSTGLAASTAPQKHLVVLVHGLSGTAADLGYLARRLEADTSVRVLASGANEPFPRTLDGVDAGGARVADEVRQVASAYKTISFVGNSLGGLYARAALRELRDEAQDTFAGLTPAIFVTTAAPHLGARQTTYGPLAPLLRLIPSGVAICVEIKWSRRVRRQHDDLCTGLDRPERAGRHAPDVDGGRPLLLRSTTSARALSEAARLRLRFR